MTRTAFTPTDWKPGVAGATPIDHVQLNRMDRGIRDAVPPGVIDDFGGPVAPPGWLPCDGAQYDKNEYVALYEAIEDTWNTGDEEPDHFRVPRFDNGVFLRGGPPDEVGATGGSAGHRHSNPSTSSAGGHSHGNSTTGSAGSHTHSNPSTSSTGSHNHSNPSTGSAGGHSHSNPSTGNAGSHSHSTGGPSATVGVSQDGSIFSNPASGAHTHSTNTTGSHSHSVGSTGSVSNHSHSVGSTGSSGSHSHSVGNTGSGGSHSHSVPDTDSVSGHSHAQADTGHEEHLPPYATVLKIIRY